MDGQLHCVLHCDCLLLADDSGHFRCECEALGEYEDCAQQCPPRRRRQPKRRAAATAIATKPTRFLKPTSQAKCESKDCNWLVTDNPEHCEMTTATPTTPSPGCCKGTQFNGSNQCIAQADEEHCERMNACERLVTDDADDCILTTTTETPEGGQLFVDRDVAA